MAWNRIQSAKGTSTLATTTATYGTALTHGTKLIAVGVTSNTVTGFISGVASGATTFTLLASTNVANNSGLVGIGIWAVDSPAGFDGTTPTITMTSNVAGSDTALLIQEVSGLAAGSTLAAMVDGTPGTIGAGTSTTTTGSPSYTSTAANEYLVAVYGDDGDGTTYTKPAALTDDANSINGSGLNDLALAFGNSTNGVEAGTWALSGGSTPKWGVLLLAFKIVAGAAPATYSPQRYGQAAPPWAPQQPKRISDPSFYPAFTVPPTPLDTAWQAGGQYSHLYADDALRDRRAYFCQRPLVSDPLLLTGPAAFDPTTGAAADTARRYGLPATHADRREVPAQHDLRDANTVATAANPLTPPLDSAWQAGGKYWQLYNTAAAYADRREVPQQRDRRDANTTGTAGGVTDPTISAQQDLFRRYGLAATHADRRLVPQQRAYPDRQPDGAYTAGPSYVTGAWWSDDAQGWSLQRQYNDPSLLATAELENELLGGGGTAMRFLLAATHADRRQVPQQRTYQDLTPFVFTYSDVGVGSGTTEAWWGQDTSPFYPAQRQYRGVDLATALLENELLGGAETGKYYRSPVTHAPRWWMPQQRTYVSDPLLLLSAELEGVLLGGAGTVMRYGLAATHADRRLVPQQRLYPDRQPDGSYTAGPSYVTGAWWSADDQGWSLQRPLQSDPNLLLLPVPLDLTTAGWPVLWLAANRAATHADRREAPQQRPYQSDPSFYPTVAPADPLTVAYGAGGPYWHLYNQAADITDRREVPYQRLYQSDPLLLTTALLENELLGGAETGKYYRTPASNAARWWMPQQPARPADPLLITTALLENELLGGADTLRRYLAACYQDRREAPQQRPYLSDPSFYPSGLVSDPLTVAWGAGGGYWHRYNQAADVTLRWWMPQQRTYPDRQADGSYVTGSGYATGAWWSADDQGWNLQRPLQSDPLLLTSALLENELLGGADAARHWLAAAYYDRREVPQQRAYISDPSFYPTTAPADPLTIAWGAGGPLWHLWNTAADITDRREVPQQRPYRSDPPLLTTAELENELLGGGETPKNYRTPATHAPRVWQPEQRAYVSDPLLLTAAELENELLGGAETGKNYRIAATHYDRREVPAQRQFFPLPPVYLDPLQSAWAALWLAYNVPATHADRRLVPAQRQYFPVPLPPPPIQIGEVTVTLVNPSGAAVTVGEATATAVSVS